MDKEEADRITLAAQNVARHYNIETTQKAVDMTALVSVLAMSYGTRTAAVMWEKRSGATKQPAQPAQPAAQTAAAGQETDINGIMNFANMPRPLAH